MIGERVPVRCPLPALVLRVDTKFGDEVRAGQVVVVLVSMKTQLEIVAPQDGRVEFIEIKEGDEVEIGDVLLYITPKEAK